MYRIYLEYNDYIDTDFIGAKLALIIFNLSNTDKRQILEACRKNGTIIIINKISGFEIRIDYVETL